MAAMSKAKRSAAAKKAARTRKRNALANRKKEKTKRGKTAKKANSAGKQAEKNFAKALLKKAVGSAHKADFFLTQKGVPDIVAHDKKGWKFYEVKPHQQLSFNHKWYTASEKRRLLNRNQRREFKKLLAKKAEVYVVYYYRKKFGTKANPRYKFRYNPVKLQKNHFKSKKGPDPEKMKIPPAILRWQHYY